MRDPHNAKGVYTCLCLKYANKFRNIFAAHVRRCPSTQPGPVTIDALVGPLPSPSPAPPSPLLQPDFFFGGETLEQGFVPTPNAIQGSARGSHSTSQRGEVSFLSPSFQDGDLEDPSEAIPPHPLRIDEEIRGNQPPNDDLEYRSEQSELPSPTPSLSPLPIGREYLQKYVRSSRGSRGECVRDTWQEGFQKVSQGIVPWVVMFGSSPPHSTLIGLATMPIGGTYGAIDFRATLSYSAVSYAGGKPLTYHSSL